MNQTIEIDDEVYDRLKEVAEPFVDTPNSVLRRLLKLDGSTPNGTSQLALPGAATPSPSASRAPRPPAEKTPDTRSSSKKSGSRKKKAVGRSRVPAGSILAEEEYEIPLLEALVDLGGSAASRDVVEAVGKKLADRLTDIDREPLKSGGIRWENRIQFVRLKMIERGWMEKDVPRGTWAISDQGRKQVAGGDE